MANELLRPIDTLPRLAPRTAESHKGHFGRILIVAGGRGMAGAAALTGAAALRSGAGLVQIACPAEVQPTVASFEPSYMTYPLACGSDGLILLEPNRAVLSNLIEQADVLAVGPGLGYSDETVKLVAWLLTQGDRPMVLDADGLNAIRGDQRCLEARTAPLVLTPHPGEFGRLTGRTTAQVQEDRLELAADFARRGPNRVVVLKGAGTIVTDGHSYHENTTGNPGMATGGAGDVLTGVIAALIGQRLEPLDAAILGAHVHGLAGDIARDENGEVSLIAGDLVDALADAFQMREL